MLLVAGDTVLTMDPDRRIVGDGAVLVDRDRIVAVGPVAELAAAAPAAERLGGPGHLVLPGLINAHQHLTGDRLVRSAIPDDIDAQVAIFEWAVPIHAAHTGDDDELSATLGLVEAVGNGITFTVEAGTVAHPDRVLAAYDTVGVGGTLGSWGWDVADAPFAGSVADVLARQRHVLEITAGHPRVSGWVTLVGHDLMSDELVTAASALAHDEGTGITFHLSPGDGDAVVVPRPDRAPASGPPRRARRARSPRPARPRRPPRRRGGRRRARSARRHRLLPVGLPAPRPGGGAGRTPRRDRRRRRAGGARLRRRERR